TAVRHSAPHHEAFARRLALLLSAPSDASALPFATDPPLFLPLLAAFLSSAHGAEKATLDALQAALWAPLSLLVLRPRATAPDIQGAAAFTVLEALAAAARAGSSSSDSDPSLLEEDALVAFLSAPPEQGPRTKEQVLVAAWVVAAGADSDG